MVFTSDHGDLLGAHGGMQQKWHNAYDEAIRVPLLVSGPGIDTRAGGREIATSHLDLLPTLLGLAGVDVEAARRRRWRRTTSRPNRSSDGTSPWLVRARPTDDAVDAPVYFMTEDQISDGPAHGQPASPASRSNRWASRARSSR